MKRKPERLGEILIARGLIISQQLETALEEQKRTDALLGEILVKRKMITEKDLLEALSNQFNIPYITIKDNYIDWDFVKEFSPSLILDYNSFPMEKDDWSVTIAITNPLDVKVLAKAEQETKGLRLKLVLVSGSDMAEVKSRYREHIKGKYF